MKTVKRTDGRDYTMDELGVWRYAYLSDVAFV